MIIAAPKINMVVTGRSLGLQGVLDGCCWVLLLGVIIYSHYIQSWDNLRAYSVKITKDIYVHEVPSNENQKIDKYYTVQN